MISAEILADSIHPITHSRLTTMKISCPRVLWDEFLTHRMFARNASSMRAIPTKRQRAAVWNDPFIPSFGENQPGMQEGRALGGLKRFCAKRLWLLGMYVALGCSWLMDRLGLHKQTASRVLFPWTYITAIVSGTDAAYANFYSLRRHEAAEPSIHALADEMARAHRESVPKRLREGDWHLPFVSDADRTTQEARLGLDDRDGINRVFAITSVARCARISYLKPDGKQATFAEDAALYQRLVGAAPVHASPAEHQAQAAYVRDPNASAQAGCFGPNSGWIQLRKTLPNEISTKSLAEAIL